MGTGKRKNIEQIPTDDEPQGGTGKKVSEQAGIEGQRKEVNVESYSKVAKIGQMLKDVEFPIDKQKIVEHIKQKHSDSVTKEKILEKLGKIKENIKMSLMLLWLQA
jgi:hypothetical protein